jgi:hypothetical protein
LPSYKSLNIKRYTCIRADAHLPLFEEDRCHGAVLEACKPE